MKKLATTLALLSMTVCGSAFAQSAPPSIPNSPDGDSCREDAAVFDLYLPGPVTCESDLSFDVFENENLFGTFTMTGNAGFIPRLGASDPLPIQIRDNLSTRQICESVNTDRILSEDWMYETITARVYMAAGSLPAGQYVYNFTVLDSAGATNASTVDPVLSPCSFVVNVRNGSSDDLDNDGIPNADDVCADTPADAIVNDEGCSIDQECPCDDLWCDADSYVRCVRTVSLQMVLSGTISWGERFQAITEAASSGCGFDSEATVLDALLGRCNSGYGWGW